ncbi:MAG TPA: ATP-binding cassette domain-containing protein [Balneolales bacterium]|nr:ATP-binding cassette domain-containing protein [Balneolales bacterium]
MSILEGVYLEVKPGKTTALIGRNGAGKSTLLKIAAGQLSADSGLTIINGQRIHERSLRKRFRKIGYLPQDSMLPDELSVSRLIKSIPSASYLKENEFIKSFLQRRISHLSVGERRFLEISVLLSLDRNYFLMDEPFTGVEPYIIDQSIKSIKRKAAAGHGILVTDHLYRYITQVADEAYLLREKQCRKLDENFTNDLKEIGYIRD